MYIHTPADDGRMRRIETRGGGVKASLSGPLLLSGWSIAAGRTSTRPSPRATLPRPRPGGRSACAARPRVLEDRKALGPLDRTGGRYVGRVDA